MKEPLMIGRPPDGGRLESMLRSVSTAGPLQVFTAIVRAGLAFPVSFWLIFIPKSIILSVVIHTENGTAPKRRVTV